MTAARHRLAGSLVLTAGLVAAASPVLAAGERPVAYVNPDTGKKTANPGVDAGSGCASPDQSDTMALGNEATGTGNVHVDACLFSGTDRVDVQAAFEVEGVGTVAACPDADGDGPKTATKSGDSCRQDGFEADNSEYHVRVVSATAGVQTVRFCADPEGNGCGDAEQTSTVRVTWGAPEGGVAAGGSSPADRSAATALALLALLAAGTAAVAGVAAGRR